ncbi:MAG: hypothetical protein JKY01_11220 [Pseudomonadales bacterium]|nr:hypothetical protein [Pseudomonadales bacterium]
MNSASPLTQTLRDDAVDGKLRHEGEGTKEESVSVDQESDRVISVASGFSAASGTKKSSLGSGLAIEERALRVRLNRLIQHESQLRQKLSGMDDLENGINQGQVLASNGAALTKELDDKKSLTGLLQPRAQTPSQSEGDAESKGLPQRLLDQVLAEKQLLQQRLDKLKEGSPPSRSAPASVSPSISVAFDGDNKSSIDQDPKGDNIAKKSDVFSEENKKSLSPTAALDSVIRESVNIGQTLSSVNDLLSSRQGIIDQYSRDGDVDSMLVALEKQDKYMEAVMAALSQSHTPSKAVLKGELVDIQI